MSRNMRRLIPSPAMLVAIVALVMSLGGSAYALVITGKSIRNNTVTGKDIRKHSLRGHDLRRDTVGGDAIRESALGQVPTAGLASSAAGLGYWAVVNNDGVLVRGKGQAAGDPAGRTSTGIYHVIFNREVRSCSYQATIASPGTAVPVFASRISVSAHPDNVNAVRVRTADGAMRWPTGLSTSPSSAEFRLRARVRLSARPGPRGTRPGAAPLAGAPAAIEKGGMSVVTTLLAPSTLRSPTVTPPVTTTFAPHHTLSPILVGPLVVKPCQGTGLSGSSKRWLPSVMKHPLANMQ